MCQLDQVLHQVRHLFHRLIRLLAIIVDSSCLSYLAINDSLRLFSCIHFHADFEDDLINLPMSFRFTLLDFLILLFDIANHFVVYKIKLLLLLDFYLILKFLEIAFLFIGLFLLYLLLCDFKLFH